MMRSVLIRLAAIGAGVVLVASCDTRLPSQAVTGSSSSGSSADIVKPRVTIDSPTTNALISVSDSILVVMQLHDDKGLGSLTLSGLTFKGSADLGTLTQTVRYNPINVPISG